MNTTEDKKKSIETIAIGFMVASKVAMLGYQIVKTIMDARDSRKENIF